MFRAAKVEEPKKTDNPNGEKKEEPKKEDKQEQKITIRSGSGARLTSNELTVDGAAIDPRIIRALTSLDIVTVDNLLNPMPVSLSTLLNPHPVTQLTRTNFLTKPEREDLISLGGVASPNGAGVLLISATSGQKIKVYDAGFHGAVDGLHYFYFGTSTSPTTRRFCSINKLGLVHKTFVQPRVGNASDALYLYSSVAETNMPYDIGYVKEA